MAKICLSIVEKLTQGAYGFVGELNEDGHLRCIALTNPGWQACTIPDSKAVLQLTTKKPRGLFARVITEARSQLENAPAHAPDRVGLPKGHPPLDRFLRVPLSRICP